MFQRLIKRLWPSAVPFPQLIKALLLVTIAPAVVLIWYVYTGLLSQDYAIYAWLAIMLANTVFIYPYLSNLTSLTRYVDELAQDRRTEAPNLSLLGAVGELSFAVANLHRSWGRKKQQMEAAIAEREILVDTIPDILLMLDKQGNIVQTNGAARLRFGQKLAHRQIMEVVNNELLLNAIHNIKRTNVRQDVEFFLAHPTETYYRARVDRFPVHSPGGIEVIITLHDITELKNTEQMRADFVANASHEIRTPLASLIGFIETLQGPARDDPQARDQFLKIMAEQAGRMSRLVNDLLSLSKLEMNAHSEPTGSVDITAIVHKIKANARWLLKEHHTTLIMELETPLPPVQGEESEVHQVIENLVGNAIKYGREDSTVTITAKQVQQLPPDPNFRNTRSAIAISVRDEGEGIPKEHLARLTERFYRVSRAKSRKVGGTGLGLAIVKHIMNRHRGVLTIESKVGVGSTFTAYFHINEQKPHTSSTDNTRA